MFNRRLRSSIDTELRGSSSVAGLAAEGAAKVYGNPKYHILFRSGEYHRTVASRNCAQYAAFA